MRIAAIYDIHGNLPALEAVLAEIRQAGVDQIVVGGDVIPGPMPGEVIAVLRDIDVPVHCIQGNGEREVLAQIAREVSANVPERFVEVMRWVGEHLTRDQREWLAGWPSTVTLEILGLGSVLFCHGTPRNDSEIFTRITPEAGLLAVFEGLDEELVVCGHTHMQFDRTVGGLQIVNAGSVGMVFGEPGAYWVLLGPEVELRRTAYDLEAAAARVRATDYPQADEFAAGSVLRPPSEAEMLEVLEKGALRSG